MTRHGRRRSRPETRPRAPVAVVVAGVIGAALFALPLFGLIWRVPWSELGAVLGDESSRTALRLSLWCSLWAGAISVLAGVPLAWLLARVRFRGRAATRALCTLPMVLPPVVGGVALFFAFGRRGVVGQYLDRWFDVRLPFTTWGVVMAQAFVAMPFLILTVEAALRQVDPQIEDAARSLGASPWYVFRRVTLPTIRPALIAGAVLAWARALGEFGATITFAGSFPGRTQTLPLAVYLALETDPRAALVLSLVLVTVSFAVLIALRDHWFSGASRLVDR